MEINRYFRRKAHALRLLALAITSCVTLASQAQLDESKTYYITNVATGKVISNLGDGANDTPLLAEDKDDASDGQKWQVKATGVDNGFIIVSARFPRAAIDMAPGKQYYPVHWTANLNSENQRFLIESVDADAGSYIIHSESSYNRTLNVESNGRLRFVQDATQNVFVFEETTPQEKPLTDYWQDAEVFEENKLPAHATFMPYASTAKLQADAARYSKPWVAPTGADMVSLNGVWNLKWTTLPATLPDKDDFWGDDVDASTWDTISVPSCLEMKGYGHPYYINEQTPFTDNYPYIKMGYGCVNSVASYRRNFTLPADWMQKRVVLHFDGMYSAAYVWVNGQYVGYSEGSNTDAEFDLSSVVRQGENNVSVRLIRFSDGSYLEGQDMWRMSGIHRDVYLYATPRTYVSDHFITASFGSANYTKADMNVMVEMRNPAKEAAGKTVQVTLIDPEGNVVTKQSAAFRFEAGDDVQQAHLTFSGLSGLKNWTAETPNLYTVEFSQRDEQSNEEMAFSTKYGFRKVEIKDNKVYVNGRQVYFKGANTQDTHPLYGRAIDVNTMQRDVIMMKQANMNTVRGSHYPRQPKMYAMFDYYGLYCMDEADIECHYNWTYGGNTLSRDEQAKAAYEDRMRRMVMRDRNYPSIVFWSLGNESGTGSNLQAAYDLCKQLDPERIVHYEGATRGNAAYTDLWSVMYPALSKVKSEANNNWRQQPYFMCEYAHAMGNAVGNLKEYWDVIESSTYGIGGCIWDFVDQSIYHADDIKAGTLTENGYPKYRSGVDFPNWNSQQNFVNNGLVPADRAWTAKLAQVKKIYQYVKFTNFNAKSKQVTLRNTYNFSKLENTMLAYSVLENGVEVENGTAEIGSVNIGMQKLVNIPYTTELAAGKEYCLNLKVVLKEATSWAEAGYPVAEEQYVLQERPATLPAVQVPADAKALEIIRNATAYTIGNDSFYCRFNSRTGEMTEWIYKDNSLIDNADNGLHLDNFRWVENDNTGGGETLGNGVQSLNLESAPVIDADGVARLTTTVEGSQTNVKYEYSIYADGTVDVKTTYTPQSEYYEDSNKRIRRIGSKMVLPATLEHVSYYARGPWDNFADRADCAFLGRYETTVTDMLEPTPRPQTSGNRMDMRELTLSDAEGNLRLVMTSEGKVDFQVLHYDDEEMTNVAHRWNLNEAKDANVVLHLDYAQMGLGNASCGQGVGTLSDYYVPSEGNLTHTVRFRPYVHSDLTGIGCIDAPAGPQLSLSTADGVLTLSGHIAAGTSVRVYDLGGSCVAAAQTAHDTTLLTIDLKAQPRGAYIVKVGGKSYKFVK